MHTTRKEAEYVARTLRPGDIVRVGDLRLRVVYVRGDRVRLELMRAALEVKAELTTDKEKG